MAAFTFVARNNFNTVPLTARTPLASLAGVVYVTPDLSPYPNNLAGVNYSWERGAVPATIPSIYNRFSSGPLANPHAPARDPSWPASGFPGLDFDLHSLGYRAGQYVAIAMYLSDDPARSPAGITCSFVADMPLANPTPPPAQIPNDDPSLAIMCGLADRNYLSWIDDDDFSYTLDGGALRTIVFVCKMTGAMAPPGNALGINLGVRFTSRLTPASYVNQYIDPGIKNDG